MSEELPIIQKTYDLIKWMVPMLGRLPRTHRFTLGNRIVEELYDLLESLIVARSLPWCSGSKAGKPTSSTATPTDCGDTSLTRQCSEDRRQKTEDRRQELAFLLSPNA